jgi:hypothetical protein
MAEQISALLSKCHFDFRMAANSTVYHEEIISMKYFGWLDFTLFILMLVLSTLIGVYFGFWGKKEDTPKEYLHGGKTMNTLPVAVSLVARWVDVRMNEKIMK